MYVLFFNNIKTKPQKPDTPESNKTIAFAGVWFFAWCIFKIKILKYTIQKTTSTTKFLLHFDCISSHGCSGGRWQTGHPLNATLCQLTEYYWACVHPSLQCRRPLDVSSIGCFGYNHQLITYKNTSLITNYFYGFQHPMRPLYTSMYVRVHIMYM